MGKGIPKATLFAMYLNHAAAMEARGVKPTGRKLVAAVRGGLPKDYPQGISGNDSEAYRNAMISLGYEQVRHGYSNRWEKIAVTLDEVACFESGCPVLSPYHTLADHNWFSAVLVKP